MRMRTPSSESSECPESPLVLGTDPEAPDSTSEPEISDADFDQRPFKNGKSHVDQKLVANYDEHLNYVVCVSYVVYVYLRIDFPMLKMHDSF